MTAQKDLKRVIRERQARTGEAYTTARMHVLGERAERVASTVDGSIQHEAVVLKVNRQSLRIRMLGDGEQVTFRASAIGGLVPIVPAHIVTLVIDKRWKWRGDEYANGRIESACIDVAKLGLDPLPLEGGELEDIREYSEPYEDDEPYGPLWKQLTAKPRPAYEFHAIAWGQLPGIDDPDENPTCIASEYMGLGKHREARALLMDALGTDLRVIDAHAHLGNLEFDRAPERAILHYDVGRRIGELSLPARDDVLLSWGMTYNRPFLRCLHGYGLCLWRRGDLAGAQRVFERILSFNPNDNQGVRFCWLDVRAGRTWEEMNAREEAAEAARRRTRGT